MYRLQSNCNPALKGHKYLSNGVDIEFCESCRDVRLLGVYLCVEIKPKTKSGGENLAYQGNKNMREYIRSIRSIPEIRSTLTILLSNLSNSVLLPRAASYSLDTSRDNSPNFSHINELETTTAYAGLVKRTPFQDL
jgi:hypothetical protein